MYGLVNKAIQELVIHQHGKEAWELVRKHANMDLDMFVGTDSYPDEITYRLVESAAEVLRIPMDHILEEFGEYWVLETAQKGYGMLLDAAGRTFPEFLRNIPNFHARIRLIYPKLNPPNFYCSNIQDNSMTFHYLSERTGLAHFVIGLLKGLGKRYSTEVDITHTAKKSQGAEHDEFHIVWKN